MPGGLRIFGCVMQGMLNLVDHGMSLQEAVEAPRLWTQGDAVEIEPAFGEAVRAALAARGHGCRAHAAYRRRHVRHRASTTTARWKAPPAGAPTAPPVGVGGGLARAGVRFWPDAAGPR